jgi:hypothetical protein
MTKIISVTIMNLITPKAEVMLELMFNKLTSEYLSTYLVHNCSGLVHKNDEKYCQSLHDDHLNFFGTNSLTLVCKLDFFHVNATKLT